jgi:hypothetical protein
VPPAGVPSHHTSPPGLGDMPDHSKTVYLVSCVSKKRRTPTQARDLYNSDWFLKARDYVEGTHSPWFILSAEYGLVPPDQVLAPYERTINAMGKPGQRKLRLKWKHPCPLRTASLSSPGYAIANS